MSTQIHLSFASFYLTIIAVATITAVATSAVAYLRNRDVRAQYAYIRSWANRYNERPAIGWATSPTNAWRRLYRPPPRNDDGYVWPTPEPWPAAESAPPVSPAPILPSIPPAIAPAAPVSGPPQRAYGNADTGERILGLDRYAVLAPAAIDSHAMQMLDTVAWPNLAEQISRLESIRSGRHRADRR
jgi:hypothetical protein